MSVDNLLSTFINPPPRRFFDKGKVQTERKIMSSLVIASFNLLDETKLKQYSAAAAETLQQYGGEFIAKGKASTLHGEPRFAMTAVIQFADRETAENWYRSENYQKIIPLRNQAMESHFQIVG